MKELWIEIDESISDDLKSNLLKSAAQVCDVILVGAKDVKDAKKTEVKIAASSGEPDIDLLSPFNEDEARS